MLIRDENFSIMITRATLHFKPILGTLYMSTYNGWEEPHGPEAAQEVCNAKCANKEKAAKEEHIWHIVGNVFVPTGLSFHHTSMQFAFILVYTSWHDVDFPGKGHTLFSNHAHPVIKIVRRGWSSWTIICTICCICRSRCQVDN